jgi:RNA polymerase sigma-70 factor (ECF subfamily)
VRREEEAHDLTQGFFTHLLEKNTLASVDPGRGTKFRSWLLGCVKHHLANVRDHQGGIAAGGRVVFESLDDAERRYRAEPADDLTPDRLYDRAFAHSVLSRALAELRAAYDAAGRAPVFDALKGTLTGDAAAPPYEEVGAALGMSVGAVKKAAFDLRARYKKALRDEVAALVDGAGHPDDPATRALVDDELRQLLAALSA